MEKNGPFFDPYNFNMQPNMQQPMQPNMQPEMDLMGSNPAMFYEQQFMYYRYLTQMLEYKIKLKEYEKMNKEK